MGNDSSLIISSSTSKQSVSTNIRLVNNGGFPDRGVYRVKEGINNIKCILLDTPQVLLAGWLNILKIKLNNIHEKVIEKHTIVSIEENSGLSLSLQPLSINTRSNKLACN